MDLLHEAKMTSAQLQRLKEGMGEDHRVQKAIELIDDVEFELYSSKEDLAEIVIMETIRKNGNSCSLASLRYVLHPRISKPVPDLHSVLESMVNKGLITESTSSDFCDTPETTYCLREQV